MENHAEKRGRTGEEANEVGSKRQKTEDLGSMLKITRAIWQKDTTTARSTLTEDRDFRELFGCGALIAIMLWQMLIEFLFLPEGGSMEHFLWSLMLMKVYGKERTLCSLAGGVDPKTFRKWTWQFISAIADLESRVVSSYSNMVNCCVLFSFHLFSF